MNNSSVNNLLAIETKKLISKHLLDLCDEDNLQIIEDEIYKNLSEINRRDGKIDFHDLHKTIDKLDNVCKELLDMDLYDHYQDKDVLSRIPVSCVLKYVDEKINRAWTRSVFMEYLDDWECESVTQEVFKTILTDEFVARSEQFPGWPCHWTGDLYGYYAYMVMVKIFFFLDPHSRKSIRITDFLSSPLYRPYLLLPGTDEVSESIPGRDYRIDPAWSQEVTQAFIGLKDNDKDLLTKEDLYKFREGDINPRVIDRLYERLPDQAQMNLSNFIEFQTALDNMDQYQAIRYFFVILTRDGKDHLDTADLLFYFRGIIIKDESATYVWDDEIVWNAVTKHFLMANPSRHDDRITLHDVLNCGLAHKFVLLLISSTAFITSVHEYEEEDDADDDDDKPECGIANEDGAL